MTSKRKKRKLKVGRLFLLIIILGIISFACYEISLIPIMSVEISGNDKYLSDNEVLEISGLDKYPSFITTLTLTVKERLQKNKYIEKASVKRKIFGFKIIIKESKVLYIDKTTGEKVLKSSRIKDDKIVCAPYLINEVPTDKKEEFNDAMEKISDDLLCLMSEIKYDPNDIDKDRYLVNMNDGNSVYLTVNKFEKINKYNEILEKIGKTNGVLYLDYGDYFQDK